jgi:hypothetical protein
VQYVCCGNLWHLMALYCVHVYLVWIHCTCGNKIYYFQMCHLIWKPFEVVGFGTHDNPQGFTHHTPWNYLLIMYMVDLGLQVQRIVPKDPNAVKKIIECEKGSYKNQVWKRNCYGGAWMTLNCFITRFLGISVNYVGIF